MRIYRTDEKLSTANKKKVQKLSSGRRNSPLPLRGKALTEKERQGYGGGEADGLSRPEQTAEPGAARPGTAETGRGRPGGAGSADDRCPPWILFFSFTPFRFLPIIEDMKRNRDISETEIAKMYDKLNRVIKSLDSIRQDSGSSDFSDRLLQSKMDVIALKKQIESLCPHPDMRRSSRAAGPLGGNSSAIMVVDDEEMVLQVTCIIISKMGLRPLSFTSSIKALEYYREHYNDISLVLLDMIMPEMNGKELFLEMKNINPPIKAMLLSGWIDKEETTNINDIGLVDFLHKPIEKAVLEKNILKALDL